MKDFDLRLSVVLLLCAMTLGSRVSDAQIQSKQIILKTIDGVNIRALKMGNENDIMLIYCHRLLSSKDSFDLDRFGSVLLKEFDVMTLDFRGHRSSEQVSDCGGNEVLDLRTAIQYARSDGYRKIVLLGVGMGATIAIRESALFGNANAVVAISPTGQPEKLRPWWWNLITRYSLTTDYGKIPIRILTTARIKGRYWTGSPVYMVDRVSPIPLLIIHGQDDRYLNHEQVQKLYDDAREPKKLLILPESGHAEELLDESTVQLIIAWIGEILSGQSIPPNPETDFLLQPAIPIKGVTISGDIVLPESAIVDAIMLASKEPSNFHEQLLQIKEAVESLHKNRGYVLSKVSEMELSEDGQLSLNMAVDQVDNIRIEGNHQVSSEKIRQSLQLLEGQSYNAWEIENAAKRLSEFPAFASVENRLIQNDGGNTIEMLIREHRPWSLGATAHFTDFGQFFGVDLSLNEHSPGALKGKIELLSGIQHLEFLYRANIQKEWLRDEVLSTGIAFEDFIYSWDNMEYYFARQESREQGISANIAYKILDNAALYLCFYQKEFGPPDRENALPVDEGFISALNLRLENQERFLLKGSPFFNWEGQTFLEVSSNSVNGDYDYTILQLNAYPEFILSDTQALRFGLHWGYSWGNVPGQKLFSLGGDRTLPGYDDDTFLGEKVFLARVEYNLNWGKWLGEISRFEPLGTTIFFDTGDARMRHESLNVGSFKAELGLEIDYASTIRLGFANSMGKQRTGLYFYFGWHSHLIRPKL